MEEKRVTLEDQIREGLMRRGMSNSEASREAFNYVNAYMAGMVEPETIRRIVSTTKN